MNRQRNEGNQTNSGNTPSNETNSGNRPRNQSDTGDGPSSHTASELLNEFNQEHPPAILVSPQDVSADIPFVEVISQEEVVVVLDDQEQAPFASSEVIKEN